jgi:hypothetical protein
MDKLVSALVASEGDWKEAKRAVPGVDPTVLDKGFKAWAFKTAGLKIPDDAKALAAEQERLEKLSAENKAKAKAASDAAAAGKPLPDADPLK